MSELRTKRDLFVIPHPDDETMLSHGIAQSQEPWVVVATDGTASTVDHIGNGFVAGGGRRNESYDALTQLGVAQDRQFYLALPDGEVAEHIPQLRDALSEIMTRYAINTVITLGEDGYDKHTDHQSSHVAAVEAVYELSSSERPKLLGLNSEHAGEHVVQGNVWTKIGAMACHVSQFALNDPSFWKDFLAYEPLAYQETYDYVSASEGERYSASV